MTHNDKKFRDYNRFYDRAEMSFGREPNDLLKKFVTATGNGRRALDLGCGDGRNSLFLAACGYRVTAIDNSSVAVAKLRKAARDQGLDRKISAVCDDIRRRRFPSGYYHLIAAITVFDHLDIHDIPSVFSAICQSLKKSGALVVRVHTTDDPGYDGKQSNSSELAAMVGHYFKAGELKKMLNDKFILAEYREFHQEDRTHGQPHFHAFAEATAIKK